MLNLMLGLMGGLQGCEYNLIQETYKSMALHDLGSLPLGPDESASQREERKNVSTAYS